MPKFIRLIFCCILILSKLGYAVDVSSINIANRGFTPFNVDAGLVGKNLQRSSSLPQRSTRAVDAPAAQTPSAMDIAGAEKITFTLNGIIFSGNTVYSDEQLQLIFKPYLHHKISLAELMNLVQEVSSKYQKNGYFLSKAILPPQEIKNGIVQVTVVEGFISNVEIQGINKRLLVQMLKKYGSRIQSIRPIRLADLERYLLLMNDIPGLEIKSVLAPDKKTPLGSDMTLVSTYKAFDITYTRDNYQTQYLGPYENTVYASLNSFFVPGGTLYGRVLSADRYDSLNYYELKYDQIIGTDGLVLSLDGYTTRTNPQFILKPLEIHSVSDDVNVDLFYPIIRSRQRNLSFQAQFDYMNNSSTALDSILYEDKIRDLTLSLLYSDLLWKGENSILLSLDKGFNFLGAHSRHPPSRLGATPNFLKVMLTASRNQFLGERFSAFVLVTAQYGANPLFAAETITFGGPFIGRGYDMAQFVGDSGVAGKAELRMNVSPNLPVFKQIQFYTFYDAGKMWNRVKLPETKTDFSGASTGAGFRAAVIPHINAEAYLAKPLTAPNATQVILGKSGKGILGFFQVSAYF